MLIRLRSMLPRIRAPFRRSAWRPACILALAAVGLPFARGAIGGQAEAFPAPPPDQAAQYGAQVAKTIVELQQFRASEAVTMTTPDGRSRTATLVNLNPFINSWFLLSLSGAHQNYHLENPDPRNRQVRLARSEPWGLLITDASGTHSCVPWTGSPSALDSASASHAAYAPVCDGRLYLRNVVNGRRTNLELAAEFIRDNVWSGEAIVDLVRDEFFHDAFRENAALESSASLGSNAPDAPKPAMLGPASEAAAVEPRNLGIRVDHASTERLLLGRWYQATGLPGVHVSVIEPSAVAPEILDSSRQSVSRLDPVESGALDYLVAFDLSRFDLGFSLGTEHPRLGWSPRPPAAVRDDALPGPDGVKTSAPLVTTGMLDPTMSERVVATFTGGFKREHGAFRYGPLASQNHGSHYGFIEAGVVFSKLQPGLATLYVLDDGSVHMKTWTEADDHMLGRIRSARQNGVPLIEPDPATGAPAPGAFVNKWGPGNWSGNADEELRSLRAGACLQESAQGRFLIYGYFSTATPSAMARVFQAYGCRYAMGLDMNALEHTYLALYVPGGNDRTAVEHLVTGMEAVDETIDGRLIPRFVGFPDNRDFFYLTQRNSGP